MVSMPSQGHYNTTVTTDLGMTIYSLDSIKPTKLEIIMDKRQVNILTFLLLNI